MSDFSSCGFCSVGFAESEGRYNEAITLLDDLLAGKPGLAIEELQPSPPGSFKRSLAGLVGPLHCSSPGKFD